jgi:hypothetical protein
MLIRFIESKKNCEVVRWLFLATSGLFSYMLAMNTTQRIRGKACLEVLFWCP